MRPAHLFPANHGNQQVQGPADAEFERTVNATSNVSKNFFVILGFSFCLAVVFQKSALRQVQTDIEIQKIRIAVLTIFTAHLAILRFIFIIVAPSPPVLLSETIAHEHHTHTPTNPYDLKNF